MKHRFLLIFLVLTGVARAQSLDLLTNLHPRPKVSHFNSSSAFIITPSTPILISDTASTVSLDYLENVIQKKFGFMLTPFRGKFSRGVSNAIYLGEHGSYPALDSALNSSLAQGETIPPTEGYVFDVTQNGIILAGTDPNGTFNSISTFAQLLTSDSLIPIHINDWPDYPIRWVFSLHNLISGSQITALEAIEDTMAAHKLNGLQQNDFKNNIYSVFEGSYPPYFYNVDSLQAYSAERNVELIPGMFPIGWSEGILFHDPDLAEGIPATASFLIQGDTGRLLGDPRVSLPHGNFENVSNGRFPGWNWYDSTIFADSTIVHSGTYGARVTNFTDSTQNGRFIKMLPCHPHSGYHMSAWVKTQGFVGEFNLLAIGFHGSSSRTLTYTAFGVPSTMNDWQQCNVIFNTLGYDSLYVYCGVWSGQAGTIWMDDFQIEDAGLTNVLRRASDIPLVTVRGKSSTYVEGKDYAMVVDSVMEKAQGTYPWHSSPGFNLLAGSAIHNGDTIDIHFIRPNPVENYSNGDGSTMVCVSEDTLYPILHDQLQLVDSQYHSKRYFMSHDEIREMNWDSACQNRNTSPAVLLADNTRKCDSIIHEVHPGAEVFDWSDMFDSLHNAYNNYYLVNGDLTGDWNLIPKDLTIVNWNGRFKSQSLDFFSKLGFSQITSPYYDIPNTVNMRQWRLAMDTIPNMRGMMYTTWTGDYSFLTPFADYAWSAGPMIVHKPFDSSSHIANYEYVPVAANVFADPYNPADSIVKVTYTQYSHLGGQNQTMVYTMFPDTGHSHTYTCTNLTQGDSGYDITYQIQATNLEGLTSTTPRYLILRIPSAGVTAPTPEIEVNIYPNPASNSVTIQTDIPSSIEIIDALGRTVLTSNNSKNNSTIDVSLLPIGTYNCVLKSGGTFQTKRFEIIR